MFSTLTMCTQLRTLRTGSYEPELYMILVPRPVVNNVTATSLCQPYYERVYTAIDNYRNFLAQQKNLILKNMCKFKDCRHLCSYIRLYLNTRKLPKIVKLGHGRCFLHSILRWKNYGMV